MVRTLGLSLFMVAVAVLVSGARAADAPKTDEKNHEGTVVSATAGKLVMTDAAGKEHSHDVGSSVKVTINGKNGELTDLKKGDKITVSMKDGKVTTITSHGAEKNLR